MWQTFYAKMFPLSIRMNIVSLLFIFVASCAYGQDRKITAMINPGCIFCTNDDTLVYIKATGPHDAIHQIWDFTYHIPTVIFAIGSINSTLDVTWNGAKTSQFVMSEKPHYSFGAAIDKLVEYDDLPDNGHIDPSLPQRVFPLQQWRWTRNASTTTENEAMVAVIGRFKGRGSVEIKLDLLPFYDYAADLPHLIHTANSTLVDITLVNLTSSRHYNASRFALHFVLASTDDPSDTMRYAMRKSLDDEHTPGVFEIVEIKTPESYLHAEGGFIQFRPVGYTQRERGVTSSTNTHISNFNRTLLSHGSSLGIFYSAQDPDKLLVQDMYISFGDPGDGYYKQHNYTAWSFTIGYGAPPLESFSLFVIVIISIGLGVPVALALSGVSYVLLRRYKARNNPARFTDED